MINKIEQLIIELDFSRLKLISEKEQYDSIGYDCTEKSFSLGRITGQIESITKCIDSLKITNAEISKNICTCILNKSGIVINKCLNH